MLRITSGLFKGRAIEVPETRKLRPSHARMRAAWMNSLQTHLPEAKVLDLFAGTGALGFEALSRGAQSVYFVENHRAHVQMILKNAQALGCKKDIKVDQSDALIWVTKPLEPFDLVFADPPYADGYELKILDRLGQSSLLKDQSLVCLEWGILKGVQESLPDLLEFEKGKLLKTREKDYSESRLTFYLWESHQ